MVSSFYSSEVIEKAKKEIWQKCPVDAIGAYCKRKDSNDRSSKVANTSDIMDALEVLHGAAVVPEFAVLSDQLWLIPKVKPGELLEYSMAERVSKLEDTIQQLCESVNRISCENASMKDMIKSRSDPTIVITPPTPSPITTPQPSYATAAKQPELPKPRNTNRKPTSRSQSPDNRTKLQDPVYKIVNLLYAQARGNHESDTEWNENGNNDVWQPPHHAKKKLKKRARHDTIRGTAVSTSTLKGGKEPDRQVYITRVDKDCATSDVNNHISNQGIEVRKLERRSDPSWLSDSFILTVPSSHLNKALHPEIWPEGICVRRFYPARTKTGESKVDGEQ